jgi:putative transposase
MARVVVPECPHHVTQRGNRRQRTFFNASDYQAYRTLLAEACARSGTRVWAYCLMPNHVHFVMVPAGADGLRAALGEAHRHYTRRINFRFGWRGHLWQERFHSFPMDEDYLLAAVRYVELNPVVAALCERPEQWPWSSAGAHLRGEDDELVRVRPMLQRVADWHDYLAGGPDSTAQDRLRQHSRTGRPLGSDRFLDTLERLTARRLHPQRAGRKPAPEVK